MTLRHIGLTLPSWPSPLRAGLHGSVTGAASRLSAAILSYSSHARSGYVRCNPLPGQASASLAVDLDPDSSRKNRRARARLCPSSFNRSRHLPKSPTFTADLSTETVPLRLPKAPFAGSLRQIRPLRRLPTHARAASVATLRPHRRPAGLASPGSTRVVNLPAVFQTGSSLGTLTFRGFSPSIATLSSRTALSSMPFLALRRRGSEDFSQTSGLEIRLAWQARRPNNRRARDSLQTDAFTNFAVFTSPLGRSSLGRCPPSRMTSRPRPTLLRDSSLGL
jgi:hypothetical protein